MNSVSDLLRLSLLSVIKTLTDTRNMSIAAVLQHCFFVYVSYEQEKMYVQFHFRSNNHILNQLYDYTIRGGYCLHDRGLCGNNKFLYGFSKTNSTSP